jgi:hypothetical protein
MKRDFRDPEYRRSAEYQMTRNEDWIKTLRWDLPDDLAGFLAALGVAGATKARIRERLQEFLALPAAEAMPQALLEAVDDIIAGGDVPAGLAID